MPKGKAGPARETQPSLDRGGLPSDRNAAVWYGDDGYDPVKSGLNGRRMAGASFLSGFFRHAEVDEFVALVSGRKEADTVSARLAETGRGLPLRHVLKSDLEGIARVGTICYASPRYDALCWNRQSRDPAAYSIAGITHTTDTKGIMQAWFELRAGPQQEWDAVICTSRAVQASSLRNIELADDFLRQRFGGSPPPLPQMPVIPIGIHCDDFRHDPQARQSLRGRMGWDADDIAVVTVARLLPFGKFDPAPLFIALQEAQARIGPRRRLHFIACGVYGNADCRRVFEDCAAELMPDVGYHHLDGSDRGLRREALSGGDIFTFPIDNTQESFGLAPIEAMAAGLPVVGSDWDGLRDTISADAGILVPTRSVPAEHTRPEAEGYLLDTLNYPQYGSRLSCMVELDLKAMAQAFATLAEDADLRRRMGEAGRRRARMLFDWAAVIPQMQDLWQELGRIRQSHRRAAESAFWKTNPAGPLPMDIFAGYPGSVFEDAGTPYAALAGTGRLQRIWQLRRHDQLGRPFEMLKTLEKVFDAIVRRGPAGASPSQIAAELRFNPVTVTRCWLFFLKYGLIAPAAPQAG